MRSKVGGASLVVRELILRDEALQEVGKRWPADPSWETSSLPRNYCNETSPFCMVKCTRTKKHSGPHIAHARTTYALCVWFEDDTAGEEERVMEMYIRLMGGWVTDGDRYA